MFLIIDANDFGLIKHFVFCITKTGNKKRHTKYVILDVNENVVLDDRNIFLLNVKVL